MERGTKNAYVEGGPLDGQVGHKVNYSVEYPANVETFHWPEEVVWEGHLYRFKRLIGGRGLGPVYEYVRTLAEEESAP
jgi:hypothetical protein